MRFSMVDIDKVMNTLWMKVVLVVLFVCGIILYLHFAAEHKQAQRELEYLKAHQRVAQQRLERHQQWERTMQQQRLEREFNHGRIIGADGRVVQ